jgi:hypothetical protein
VAFEKFPHSVVVNCEHYTQRANHLPVEGGALNAGYTPVDALCMISNLLGKHGLQYNVDWWWEGFASGDYKPTTGSTYKVKIRFAKEEYALLLNLNFSTTNFLAGV